MGVKLVIYDRREYNKNIIESCEKIVDSHHVSNGGTLVYKGLVKSSHFLVLAKDDSDKIIGFVALVNNFYGLNDLYIYQMAVDKSYLKQGVGYEMLDFIKGHIKGCKYLTADVRKSNVASNNLLLKLGFDKKSRDAGSDNNFYIFELKRNLNNSDRLTKR